MNWVGGARNRLKVPNERKLQKEYFERRRLDTRLSRGPTLHQSSTAPVSKDLLFLSKTAENDFIDRSPRSVPIRVNLDSAARHPMRDIELPMSPIEKPSMLELADTSVISSLDNSFYRAPLNTASLPRVSTMKLPRGPAANQMKENRERVMDDLFAVSRPPPVQEKDQSTTDGRVPNNLYSLDDLLNASQIKESHLSKPQRGEQNQRPSKFAPRHADELLWANLGGLSRKRNAPSAIEGEHSRTKRAAIRPQKDLDYNFGGWKSHSMKFKTATNHGSKMELVQDKDAMLEIYYAPKQTTKIDHCSLFDDPPRKKQQQRKKEKQPRPHLSSLLTENPFSNHHLLSPKIKKPQNPIKQENNSDITIHNESILGPIKKKNEQPVMRKDKATAFEKMMSSFEDSHCYQGNDVEDVIVGLAAEICIEDTSQKKNQHSRWKDFVSLEVSTSQERPWDKLIKKPPAKEKKNMNCSAWEELTCLEREVLDTCTQELTLSPIDCTEEPIMRLVPDVSGKIALTMYPFDSSQESSLSANSHSQSRHKPPNQRNPETTCSQGEIKSAEEAKLYVPRIVDNMNTSCSVTTMDTIETRVPLSPVVDVVSTTEATNVHLARNNDRTKHSPVFENSVPAKLFATLSTQTTPSIVYHSKHQEQQTSPSTSVMSTQPQSSPLYVTLSRPESANPVIKKENVSLKNASVQAGPSNISELIALKEEVDKLQEELKSAESTIVWLSLMMRIKDIS